MPLDKWPLDTVGKIPAPTSAEPRIDPITVAAGISALVHLCAFVALLSPQEQSNLMQHIRLVFSNSTKERIALVEQTMGNQRQLVEQAETKKLRELGVSEEEIKNMLVKFNQFLNDQVAELTQLKDESSNIRIYEQAFQNLKATDTRITSEKQALVVEYFCGEDQGCIGNCEAHAKGWFLMLREVFKGEIDAGTIKLWGETVYVSNPNNNLLTPHIHLVVEEGDNYYILDNLNRHVVTMSKLDWDHQERPLFNMEESLYQGYLEPYQAVHATPDHTKIKDIDSNTVFSFPQAKFIQKSPNQTTFFTVELVALDLSAKTSEEDTISDLSQKIDEGLVDVDTLLHRGHLYYNEGNLISAKGDIVQALAIQPYNLSANLAFLGMQMDQGYIDPIFYHQFNEFLAYAKYNNIKLDSIYLYSMLALSPNAELTDAQYYDLVKKVWDLNPEGHIADLYSMEDMPFGKFAKKNRYKSKWEALRAYYRLSPVKNESRFLKKHPEFIPNLITFAENRDAGHLSYADSEFASLLQDIATHGYAPGEVRKALENKNIEAGRLRRMGILILMLSQITTAKDFDAKELIRSSTPDEARNTLSSHTQAYLSSINQ